MPDLVKTALSLTGVPYRDGGSDPSGFDCSGFVEYVFAAHGVPMPRTVAGQFRLGQHIAADALAAGDLVFFSTIAPGASHVGIAISAVVYGIMMKGRAAPALHPARSLD